MRTILTTILALGLLGSTIAAAADKPTSVIHVINVKWKADASPKQIQEALDRAHQLPAKYPGITRVWTKNIKFQLGDTFTQAIVMEFRDQAALTKYADSPAQKWWYEAYLPIREESRTNDITN